MIELNEAGRKEVDLEPALFEMLSTVGALIQTIPR